jgi:hypothetical protein
VTALGLLAGRPLPGLHTVPDSAHWVLARLMWLPLFTVALLILWAIFHTYEKGRPRKSDQVQAYIRMERGGPGTRTSSGARR